MKIKIKSWKDLLPSFPEMDYIYRLEKTKKITFRTYQAAALLLWHTYGCRGVIRAATGSGKTLIAAALVSSMLPKKALILIHGKQLLAQTHDVFKGVFPKSMLGFISGKTFHPSVITLCSIDTLGYYFRSKVAKGESPKEHFAKAEQLREYLKTVDLLVLDECHHSSSDGWLKVSELCPAPYRAGLSGTPMKHDILSDMLMMSHTGPVIFDLNTQWLQQNNFLAKARLIVKKQDWSTKDSRGLAYPQARERLIVKNTRRTEAIAQDICDVLKEPKTSLLVLTGNSVDLTTALGDTLRGLESFFPYLRGAWMAVTGKMDSKVVKQAIDDLRNKKIRCLIVTKLADEGIDLPAVNTLFIVGGGKAYVSTVQRIGRGLRLKEENEELMVYDYHIIGNTYLEKHDKARLKIYEQEGCFSEITLKD